MAYLDLSSTFTDARPISTPVAPPARPLSALEWSVIAVARRDRLSSLSEPGPLSRALGSLFGRARSSRLADPRLEALRRFAVHAWHGGYQLPLTELKALIAAGFSREQAEAALASIAVARANRPSRTMAAG